MRKILPLFALLISISFLNGQIEGCDGSRFIDDIFTEVDITRAIKFGEGETVTGTNQELFLDVYEPVNDDLEMRPVIILAFGGSFIGGERGDVEFLCEAYARKGYVAVAIDYRLYDGPLFPIPSASTFKEVVVKTVSDMKAAIRHMRQDADTENLYRINPSQIYVGGISAGAITAFHTAVLDEDDDLPDDIRMFLEENGGIEGNTSSNYEYSSEAQGIINYSGGLNDASWIDENDPPFVSIHDDMDPVVPFGQGFASVLGIPIVSMEGSMTCHEIANNVGIANELRTIENSNGHVSYFFGLGANVAGSINYTAGFVADLICNDVMSSLDEVEEIEMVTVSPNPTNGLINIEGMDHSEYSIEVWDISGKLQDRFFNQSNLDLNHLNNGTYFLRILDFNEGRSQTLKIVLAKA